MVSVPKDPLATKTIEISPVAQPRAARRGGLTAGQFVSKLCIAATIAAVAVGCYFAISQFVFQSVEVVGTSMVPTLSQGSHYILNKMAYRNAAPQHGDIVVIRDPGDHGFSVKRVIATAGESIHLVNGKVYVNSEELDEPYLLPRTYTFTYAAAHEQLITCGVDQYFVLGDNRPASIDSRSYGPVSRQDILGKVVLSK